MTGVGLAEVLTPGVPTNRERATERFRPDLEGLRGVAVLLVVLFHAGLPGFSGGYVGVDVFFVLSGFLITGILLRELEARGSIDLPAFYARRARRLLPAAAVALAGTVVASAVLLPPLQFADVAWDGAAAALYVSNIRFGLMATDYLQSQEPPSPLLHYWSLGVEEQFYVCWPAILLLATRLRFGSPRRLGVVIGGIAAVSLAVSIALTQIAAPLAFYLLPTRAWELALGALIALTAHRAATVSPARAAAAVVGGVLLIVAAGGLFDTATSYPGLAALMPTLGAGLVIAGGLGSPGRRPLAAASLLLGSAPLRWLGRISYSLYLWHWPMLVIPAAASTAPLPLPLRLALTAASLPIAAASQRWVEEPIRRGRLVGFRPVRGLAMAGALSLLVAGGSLVAGSIALPRPASTAGLDPGQQLVPVLGTPGASPSLGPAGSPAGTSAPGPAASPPTTLPGPVPADLRPPLAVAHDNLPVVYADGCQVSELATTSGPCAYGASDPETTVVLFGDSHAAQWFPALERLAIERSWRLVSLTKALCGAVDHRVWNGHLGRPYPECDAWRDHALERIARERPALVVVANSKFASFEIDGRQATTDETAAGWSAAVAAMLRELAGASPAVALIGDTPQMASDPADCLSAHLDDALACARPRVDAVDWERMAADRSAAAEAGAAFVDPTPWVCPTEPCPVVIGSLLVYLDAGHISATFSAALAPYLAADLPVEPAS